MKQKFILPIKIIPKSHKNEIVSFSREILKIKIKEIPEKGKANKELVYFLSKLLKISKNSIEILKGKTSQNKLIEIQKITKDDFEKIIIKNLKK